MMTMMMTTTTENKHHLQPFVSTPQCGRVVGRGGRVVDGDGEDRGAEEREHLLAELEVRAAGAGLGLDDVEEGELRERVVDPERERVEDGGQVRVS